MTWAPSPPRACKDSAHSRFHSPICVKYLLGMATVIGRLTVEDRLDRTCGKRGGKTRYIDTTSDRDVLFAPRTW